MAIKCLKFSSLIPNVIATGGATGKIGIYDLESKNFLPTYLNVHTNNCSALAFSPNNENILISSGLDEALNFIDLREKKAIKTIYTDYPITALDVSEDGKKIVMGSYFGDIQGIDIRHE